MYSIHLGALHILHCFRLYNVAIATAFNHRALTLSLVDCFFVTLDCYIGQDLAAPGRLSATQSVKHCVVPNASSSLSVCLPISFAQLPSRLPLHTPAHITPAALLWSPSFSCHY